MIRSEAALDVDVVHKTREGRRGGGGQPRVEPAPLDVSVELAANNGANLSNAGPGTRRGGIDCEDLVEGLSTEVREGGRGEQAHEEQLVEHIGLQVEGVRARGGDAEYGAEGAQKGASEEQHVDP